MSEALLKIQRLREDRRKRVNQNFDDFIDYQNQLKNQTEPIINAIEESSKPIIKAIEDKPVQDKPGQQSITYPKKSLMQKIIEKHKTRDYKISKYEIAYDGTIGNQGKKVDMVELWNNQRLFIDNQDFGIVTEGLMILLLLPYKNITDEMHSRITEDDIELYVNIIKFVGFASGSSDKYKRYIKGKGIEIVRAKRKHKKIIENQNETLNQKENQYETINQNETLNQNETIHDSDCNGEIMNMIAKLVGSMNAGNMNLGSELKKYLDRALERKLILPYQHKFCLLKYHL